MQEAATACNAEKLAVLSTIAMLDRQICEAQGSMTKLLAACDRSCSNDLQALRAEHSRLEVCQIRLHAVALARPGAVSSAVLMSLWFCQMVKVAPPGEASEEPSLSTFMMSYSCMPDQSAVCTPAI